MNTQENRHSGAHCMFFINSRLLVFCMTFSLIITTGLANKEVHAGVLSSSISRVTAEKAAQKAAAKTVAEKTAIKKAAAEKAAAEDLAVKKVESERANRLFRENKISEREKFEKNYAYDLERDKKLVVKPNDKERNVRRFVSSEEKAEFEMKAGIPPDSHMAARPAIGRPPLAETAKKQYGLEKEPAGWYPVTVPKGQPVRKAQSIGSIGTNSWEITSSQKIPPTSIGEFHPYP